VKLVETEEPSGPPRGLLLSLGLIGIILGAAIAGEFVLRLQPQLGGGSATVVAGVTSIIMPANAASVNFSPENATVFVGVNNTIQWTNQDNIDHTVVVCPPGAGQLCSPSAALASSPIMIQGNTFTVTLNATGVYHYYCSIHSATMRGTIVVKGGATIAIPSGTASQQLNYSPSVFTVVIGINNTVTFVNMDTTTHTVTSNTGDNISFESGDIAPGHSWAFAFTVPGTYAFHCNYHTFMKGTITVKAASS
jgi:plastocyanin